MNMKTLTRVEIKDADKGEIAAVFSTFDSVDHDGDVTVKGAFTDGQPVAISAYGHGSSVGAMGMPYGVRLPVGKGRVRELSTEAVMEGRYFLDTTAGMDEFRTVKALSEPDGPGTEWSYNYTVKDAERGTFDGKSVRILKGLYVHEVSPVLQGAGIGTRTLAVKGMKQPNSELATALRNAGRERFGGDNTYVWAEDYDVDESWVVYSVSADDASERLVRVAFARSADGAVELDSTESEVERTVGYSPKSRKFSEQASSVLADVTSLIDRATEVVALRAAKGKGIADASADLLRQLDAELERLKALYGEPRPEHTTPSDDDLRREYARFVALTNGVTF